MSRRTLLAAGATLFLAACTSSSSAGTTSNRPSATEPLDSMETMSSMNTDATVTNPADSAVAAGAVTVDATDATDATGVIVAAGGANAVATDGFNPLWIPPTVTGPSFDLTLASATSTFFDGDATPTIGYNGSAFWGPTLLMRKGDQVSIAVHNALAAETTAHWHGVHLPAKEDGGPHQPIPAGGSWTASFEVKNDAATYWYHPHMHATTQAQLNLGAGGFIIVQDEVEDALALPRTYGTDDIPLALTSRKFLDGNVIDTAGIYGDYLLANGVMNAEVTLPAQMVRFRLLNCEVERAYDLGFSDGRIFSVIGTDGGLVNAPVAVSRLIMTPGERYEIVVDLSGDAPGSALSIQAFNGGQEFGFGGGENQTTGEFGSLLNNVTFNVLRLNVVAANGAGITVVPTTLADNTYWTEADATNQRSLSITDQGPGTAFTFDGGGYEMDTINQTVTLDTVERWTVQNGRTFGHSFHIHDVQFAIVSRSSGEVAAYERGWKDTFYIRIDEAVSFVARFDDFASTEHPYMYHCHMANHEDGGLMGQFLVVPT